MSDGDALQFRDPEKADRLTERLETLMDEIGHPVNIMHVCGTHEQSIAKYGLRSRLPDGLSVRMGPGCPVCVTNMPEVDEAVALAEDGKIVATYGDMFQVPGTEKSLEDAKGEGADVRVVYSASEAHEIAEANPDNDVVFFATGFETTAAPTATRPSAWTAVSSSTNTASTTVPSGTRFPTTTGSANGPARR